MYHGVTRSGSDERAPQAAERGPSPAPSNGDAKKERVLHTRVPAVLERELKRFADNLRVPVSNLVRTILEDAVSVADAATESVEERLKKAAKTLEKERERIKKKMEHDPLEGILAFQEVVLAMPARCAKCEKELARGSKANLAIGENPGHPRRFVCDECVPPATT
jgi:hypothetical protein